MKTPVNKHVKQSGGNGDDGGGDCCAGGGGGGGGSGGSASAGFGGGRKHDHDNDGDDGGDEDNNDSSDSDEDSHNVVKIYEQGLVASRRKIFSPPRGDDSSTATVQQPRVDRGSNNSIRATTTPTAGMAPSPSAETRVVVGVRWSLESTSVHPTWGDVDYDRGAEFDMESGKCISQPTYFLPALDCCNT